MGRTRIDVYLICIWPQAYDSLMLLCERCSVVCNVHGATNDSLFDSMVNCF